MGQIADRVRGGLIDALVDELDQIAVWPDHPERPVLRIDQRAGRAHDPLQNLREFEVTRKCGQGV